MSKLLSSLAVALVTTVLFGTSASALSPIQDTDLLLTVNKPVVVVKQEPVKETPKKEEPKKEAPKPKVLTYRVKAGDTLTEIAKKHNVSWKRIWSKNKVLKHQDVLTIGQKLVIPSKSDRVKNRKLVSNAVQTTSQTPNAPQRASQSVTEAYTASRPSTGEPNGYAVGWCTWWVKEKRPDIGGYWGDAGYNWISAAQAAGFSTGSLPAAGAIGVTAGHVVYVESVSGGNVNISEMGWNYSPGVANYRSVSASSFQYIY